MMAKLKSLLENKTVQGTFIVTMGVFIGSIFSYLLQIGLGHLLSVEDFGTFNALLSLSIISGIPAGAVSTALIKKVTELLANRDFYTLKKFFWNFVRLSLGLGLLLAFVFILLSKAVAGYLNISDTRIVLVFGVFLAFSFLNIAPQSYLQGLLRYKAFSFFSSFSQLLRLAIPLGLVYVGLGVGGVYLGITIVGLISFLISTLLLKKNFRQGITPTANALTPNFQSMYRELLNFSVPVLLITLGLSLLSNTDVVMVKHFFTAYEAGVYAGVVTMGKVFLFGAAMIQVVMFPQIANLFASKGNYVKRFKRYLFLQIGLIVAGAIVFSLFPVLINRFMFGGKFMASVTYLPLFTIFVAEYVLLNFLSIFLLAVNKTKAYLFILPAGGLQYLLITLFHSNLFDVIKIDIITSTVACFLITIYVVQSLREGIRNHSDI